MTKAPRIKFVIVVSFALSIGFWMAGYFLALDPSAFVKNNSWLYQVVWLPVHVVCGYLAVCIYREALSRCHPETGDLPVGVITYLNYLLKKLLIATLAVMPFLVMDGFEGYEMVRKELWLAINDGLAHRMGSNRHVMDTCAADPEADL